MQDDPIFEGVDEIKAHVESWQDLDPEELHVERLGGLSNLIWKVSVDNDEITPKTVIYRKFGEGGAIVDRERENTVLKGLAKRNIAPKFYGGDEEYRVEKFHEAKELTHSELAKKVPRRKVARLMGNLHNIKFEKLEKTPLFLRILNESDFIKSFKEKVENAEKEELFLPVEKKMVDEIVKLTSEEEIEFLKGIVPSKDKVVFSHNDLHSENVMILPEGQKYLLIDFEYSDYNYRGYDLANFFNEFMFQYGTAKHPHYSFHEDRYPSDEELLDFIKYYIFFKNTKKEDYDKEQALNSDGYRDSFVKKNQNIDKFNKEAEEILQELKVCALFSHYFWSLWAVIRSKNGDGEFDYIHYARKRYELYEKLKKNFTNKKNSNENNEQGGQNASDP